MDIEWLTTMRQACGDKTFIATLATVDLNGSPRARSIVIRQITPDGLLWFTSDARSGKSAQLAHCNEAELVIWLAEPREQFRLVGTVTLLDTAEMGGMRLQLWRRLNDSMRATFFWPPPGEPRVESDALFSKIADKQTPMPASFQAISFQPSRVELLSLKAHPHRRCRWCLEAQWRLKELNP